MLKIKVAKEKIFLYLLGLTILIDYMNGLFQGFHIGEVYRSILLIYCGCIILSNKKEACRFLLILSFLFINTFVSILFDESQSTLKINVTMGLKTILFYTVSTAIILLYKKGIFQRETIDKIIRISLIYTPILFALSSVMGNGGAGYIWNGVALGTKAKFLSLNSINSALIAIFIYCVYHFFSERKMVWILCSVYIAIPMLALGTKTSLAAIIILPVFFAILRITNRQTVKMIILLSIFLIIIIPIIWPYFTSKMAGVLDRQKYLFEHRSLWSYLTSTRSERVAIIWNYYVQHYSIVDIFPGRGYHYFHHIISNLMGYTSDVIPIEMDWMDILTSYGIWGFAYTYIYALKPIFKYQKIHKSNNCKMYRCIIIVMVAYGSFAGHVFMEAISSTFLALCFCGFRLSIKEKN